MPQVPKWARFDLGRGVAVDDGDQEPLIAVTLPGDDDAVGNDPAPLIDPVNPDAVAPTLVPDEGDDLVFALDELPEPPAPAAEGEAGPPPEPDFDLVTFDGDAAGLDGRWLWRVAVALLVLTTAAAALLIGRSVAPAAARTVGDGWSWAAAEVRAGGQEAADAWERWTGSLTAVAAANAEREAPPLVAPEGSRSLLIAVSDADDRGVAFALLARSPAGVATLALAPPGLLAVQPGFGDFPLSEATVFADGELAALTLTNLLGVRIDDVLWLRQGELAAALPAGVDLDLPVPLIVSEGDEGRVLAKSGRAERTPAAIEAIVATQGLSDQLEWMQRQGAAWAAVFAALADTPDSVTALAAHAGEADEAAKLLFFFFFFFFFSVTAIPVTQVTLGRTDGYTLASDVADAFLGQRFGHLMLRPEGRPRVELLNGNGQVGATRLLAQELVRRGYRVIKTDNASNFDYETTQVIAQGRTHRVDAQAVLDLLGSGELLLEVRAPSGVVDISIIVGQDIPAG